MAPIWLHLTASAPGTYHSGAQRLAIAQLGLAPDKIILKPENIVNRLEIACAELIRIRQDPKFHYSAASAHLLFSPYAPPITCTLRDIEEDYMEYQYVF